MACSVELFGGASRDRTDDLIIANDALSQLSYSPTNLGVLHFRTSQSYQRLADSPRARAKVIVDISDHSRYAYSKRTTLPCRTECLWKCASSFAGKSLR